MPRVLGPFPLKVKTPALVTRSASPGAVPSSRADLGLRLTSIGAQKAAPSL